VIRIAAALQILALAIVAWMAVDTSGRTAIAFSFVGAPLLVLGLAAYAFARWREGAFGSTARPPADRAS